jgi:uncharacterized CHY-type Zn-finger protein
MLSYCRSRESRRSRGDPSRVRKHQSPNFTPPTQQSSSLNQHHNTMPPRVHGLSLTHSTQCTHWNSDLDIIAIKHYCCSKFYACISCHNELESHEPTVWPFSQRDERAVLCGECNYVLSIEEYLHSGSRCTSCGAGFNPGCKGHWGMYFKMEDGKRQEDDVKTSDKSSS